jgi:hypothetical protein
MKKKALTQWRASVDDRLGHSRRFGDILGAGVLRDRNDLKFLTGCTDYIANSFAHQ